MRLNAGCKLLFEATAPASLIVMLRPRSGAGQKVVREANEVKPHALTTDFVDINGNLCERLLIDPGCFEIESTVTVDTSDRIDIARGAAFVPVYELPEHTLPFLLPSRYCQSDILGDLAQTITEGLEDASDQVQAISGWIHVNIEYHYDTSNASTSALDTVSTRIGACRDFVHLGIALCRSLTIPARMVVGYLYKLEPMDLHAWFEAYVGGRWYIFDPTQAEPRGSRIAIAYGKDAADVALVNQFGPVELTGMKVWVEAAQQ
jgi:transglutaminase-like putative cysteine protease